MDKIHLIKLCQSGDREALGILYQTYLIPMREIVAYYVNNTDAVWDILHDGFLVAFASIGSLKNSEKVEPWLASIMKNLAFQYLRDKSKKIISSFVRYINRHRYRRGESECAGIDLGRT